MATLNTYLFSSIISEIKVSTVHSMAVLSQSDPPSSGDFNPAFGDTMKALLEFLKGNGSPLTINPYPFFAYQSDPRPDTLSFCLFQPNAGRVDSNTNIKYMNMFDAQIICIVLPLVVFSALYFRRRDVYDLHHAALGILYSVLITGVITDVIKDGVGRPRPDFFWRCFPNGTGNFDPVTKGVLCNGRTKVVAMEWLIQEELKF